jgi:Acetyltransferase (GNAT) domain
LERQKRGANMLLFDRRLGGFLRYRKVFLATEAQLAELIRTLGPFDILRSFSTAVPLDGPRLVLKRPFSTAVVDLTKGEDAIYGAMHKNCRYKVRRAEKLHDRIEIRTNSETVRRDFIALHNAFVHCKRNVPSLTPRLYHEFVPQADIFVLYFDRQPTCGRLVLRDEESRTVLMTHSAISRLPEGADPITVGLLNRYLYWYEMKTYSADGMESYDFGGAGGIESLTQFKLSFGAQLVPFSYCMYAGAFPLGWKVVHLLYEIARNRLRKKPRPSREQHTLRALGRAARYLGWYPALEQGPRNAA